MKKRPAKAKRTPKRKRKPHTTAAAMFEKICRHIETTGDGVLKTCQLLHVSTETFYRFRSSNDAAAKRYARAKDVQADAIVQEAIDIADDISGDTVTRTNRDGSEYETEDHEWVNRCRIRVDIRKWLAGKLRPKKYGDRVELVGDEKNPVTVLFNVPRPAQPTQES